MWKSMKIVFACSFKKFYKFAIEIKGFQEKIHIAFSIPFGDFWTRYSVVVTVIFTFLCLTLLKLHTNVILSGFYGCLTEIKF